LERRITTGEARVVLAAMALVFACWASAPARAADYRQIVLDGHTMKWGTPVAGSGAALTYAVVDDEQSFAGARNCPVIDPPDRLLAANNIARPTFDHEVDAAFSAWSSVADIRFHKVSPPDADILIGAEATPAGRAFTNVEYADPGQPTGRASLTHSVICLNPQQRWKVGFDGNLDVYDLRYALTHEIGHAIGLDHPGQTGELMDFRYQETFRIPQLGDIAGATFVYGPSPVLMAAQPGVVRKVNATAAQP
jgi:hypothetical protein